MRAECVALDLKTQNIGSITTTVLQLWPTHPKVSNQWFLPSVCFGNMFKLLICTFPSDVALPWLWPPSLLPQQH